MNCDYLLIYVIVSNFANQKRNCFSGLSSFQNIQSYGNTYCWHFALLFGLFTLYLRLFKNSKGLGKLEKMKEFYGEKNGTIVHVVFYTIVPIALGIIGIIAYFMGIYAF